MSNSQIRELEQVVLRSLCAPAAAASARIAAIKELAGYHWQDPDHRIVFDALSRLQGHQLDDVRANLPAVVTRMGFPDVNWDVFFVPASQITTDPPAAARALLAGRAAARES